MLSELIRLLEGQEGELDLQELGRRLDAQPSAVAGMVETLIGMGRVTEMGPDCGLCDSCDLAKHCTLPAKRARRFRVV
jgi:Mn-dependent DtxR family transcriptional regulator